jgi:methyl-accepting chemotaxis protein
MLKNIKVGMKLGLGFGLVVMIMVFSLGFGIVNIRNVATNNLYIMSYPSQRHVMLNEIATELMNIQRIVAHMSFYAGNPTALLGLQSEANYARLEIALHVNEYVRNINADPNLLTANRRQLLYETNRFRTLIANYANDILEGMYAGALANDPIEMEALFARGTAYQNDIAVNFDNLVSHAIETMDYYTQDIEITANRSTVTMVVLALGCALFGIVVAYFISGSVTKPIRIVSAALDNVAKGNLDFAVDISHISKDETGDLMRNVHIVKEALKTIMFDLTHINHEFNVVGDINYRADAGKYQNSFKEVMESVNKLLDNQLEDVNTILGVMNQIVDGDFNVKVRDLPGKKEILPQTVRAVAAGLQSVSAEIGGMITAAATKGDLRFKIDETKYKNDWRAIMTGLNQVAQAVDEPLTEIRTVMNKVRMCDFDATVEGNYAGDFLAIKNDVNEVVSVLRTYIGEIAACLYALAAGDLTHRINGNFYGEFSQIENSITHINDSLRKTITEIDSASGQLLTGVKLIANRSGELNQGAVEQAASVQKINTAIDLMVQQTKQNAHNAEEASTLSNKSTQNAVSGHNDMKNMLDAMTKINESSRDISRIIKIIQDIAFQTNLLALNASVEAARAGEQGKGFSVVAEEVRNLANRSQSAASETTEKVEDSIDRVKKGSDMALSTAAALDIIVANAGEVMNIINGISVVSRQQAEAIGNLGDGIEQISRIAQNNLAVSEETASAAQELNTQAESLKRLVSYFRA